MVSRYIEGQVYCVRCGYMLFENTHPDCSGHARCNYCSSRVRTAPRSSKLKIRMKEVLANRLQNEINNSRLTVPGEEMINCQLEIAIAAAAAAAAIK